MNSAYNFYREGVMSSYYKRIGDSKQQHAALINQVAIAGLLFGFGFLTYYIMSGSKNSEGVVES